MRRMRKLGKGKDKDSSWKHNQVTVFKVVFVEIHPRDELAASLWLKTRHFFHAQFAAREREGGVICIQ